VSWTHHQFVLYLAAVPLVLSRPSPQEGAPLGVQTPSGAPSWGARRWAIVAGGVVAAIMIVPLDLLAAVGLGESRVLLAVAIALVPAAWWPCSRIDTGLSSPAFDGKVGLDSPPSMGEGRVR
jgi:hypothetical protein